MSEIETKVIHRNSYPETMRSAPDHLLPMALFVQGEIPERCLAVVGTREPSEFGIRACERIVQYAVEQGFGIVSGLARGIDRVAHETAIACGGKTIAVLAHGLPQTTSSRVYPSEHIRLYLDILNSGGAGVSEYEFGTSPNSDTFVARNLIQVLLSVGTVAVQANFKSGTASTVRQTLAVGRPLWMPLPLPQSKFFNDPKCEAAKYLSALSFRELSAEIRAQSCPFPQWAISAGDISRLNAPEDMVANPIRSREDFPPLFFSANRSFYKLTGKVAGLVLSMDSKMSSPENPRFLENAPSWATAPKSVNPEKIDSIPPKPDPEESLETAEPTGCISEIPGDPPAEDEVAVPAEPELFGPKDKISAIIGRTKISVLFGEEIPPLPSVASPQRSILSALPAPVKLSREESLALHGGTVSEEAALAIDSAQAETQPPDRHGVYVYGVEKDQVRKERRIKIGMAAAESDSDPMIAYEPRKRASSPKDQNSESSADMDLPAPKRRGRPPGSKNKKTLEREASIGSAPPEPRAAPVEPAVRLQPEAPVANRSALGYARLDERPLTTTCPACGRLYGSKEKPGCFICGG